jgi:hypothetical protein
LAFTITVVGMGRFSRLDSFFNNVSLCSTFYEKEMKMCKCIVNIEKLELKSTSTANGKKVTSFEFTEDAVGQFFNFKTGKDIGPRTKSTVRYTLEGQKKIIKSYMRHTFCPFCGVRYK